MRFAFKFQKSTVELRDKRVEYLTELFQGARLIKMLGWEDKLAEQARIT